MTRVLVEPRPARHRFTADEYEAMIEFGLLRPEARLELIEGEIIERRPIGAEHAACVRTLIRLLGPYSGARAILDVQNPIRLSDDTEPQPDLTLARRRSDFYDSGLPAPQDILLVVEAADTSVAYDHRLKMPHYARNGIVESWLIDLNRRTLDALTRLLAAILPRQHGAALAGEQ